MTNIIYKIFTKMMLDALHFGTLVPTHISVMAVGVSPIRGLPADYPISIFFNYHD
jgi:hypothetical protein